MSRLTCDEASDEPPSVSNETFTKIECNINMGTNFMMQGILNVRIIYISSRIHCLKFAYAVPGPKS